jgi:Domain of unknown function (DUF4232)
MPEQRHMRIVPTLLAVVGLVLVAGVVGGLVGSRASTTTTTVARTVTVRLTVTDRTTPTRTGRTSTRTTKTRTTATPPACSASDLALSYEGSNGAPGELVLYFGMRNSGSRSCRTYGYPGVQFLDRDGNPLPTAATRTIHDVLGSTPAVALTLAPGKLASFRMIAAQNPTGTGCTTAYALQAIAPNDTATIRATIPGGVPECGVTTVSPLQPGTAVPSGT